MGLRSRTERDDLDGLVDVRLLVWSKRIHGVAIGTRRDVCMYQQLVIYALLLTLPSTSLQIRRSR